MLLFAWSRVLSTCLVLARHACLMSFACGLHVHVVHVANTRSEFVCGQSSRFHSMLWWHFLARLLRAVKSPKAGQSAAHILGQTSSSSERDAGGNSGAAFQKFSLEDPEHLAQPTASLSGGQCGCQWCGRSRHQCCCQWWCGQ